ncbi:hypothetical protein [Erythrobacter sp. SD-21]|uniref:hypothetical protein n=1 Tax=Erythrobacter sp. SD-21 TaxID=161528 RepID=UPI0012EAAE77|nr:hypothetical protein [Erythrobacter sp. SD-21]
MRYPYSTNLPERVIVLSLALPPLHHEPAAPFGFGAFIVSRRWRNDAAFAAHAHGYGAGYDPRRMRVDIGKLFTPETKALIHIPAPSHSPAGKLGHMPLPSRFLAYVPRSGLAANIHARIPHDQLVNAANIGVVEICGPSASPLQRIGRIGDEAQAAWIFWLLTSCSPHIRRGLLASFTAWRALEQARRRQLTTW